MNQDTQFLQGEGDAWYRRNRGGLLRETDEWAGHDVPLRLLRARGGSWGSVLELGCSLGRRLDVLSRAGTTRAVGTDASAEAIAEGSRRYPSLDLRHALISTPIGETFDLVIVNFVLHWVDRSSLASTVAAIDSAVRREGHLLLGDFLPDRPVRRDYAHKPGLYTYKQDYSSCFTALGLYEELERRVFDHDDPTHPERPAAEIDAQRRGGCVLLRKTDEGYTTP